MSWPKDEPLVLTSDNKFIPQTVLDDMRIMVQPKSEDETTVLMDRFEGKQTAKRSLPMPQKDPEIVRELELKLNSCDVKRPSDYLELNSRADELKFDLYARVESPFQGSTDCSSDEASTQPGDKKIPPPPPLYPPILTDFQQEEKPENYSLMPSCTCRYIFYDGHVFSHLRQTAGSKQSIRCRRPGCMFGGNINPETQQFEEVGRYHTHKRPNMGKIRMQKKPWFNYYLIPKEQCTYCPVKISFDKNIFTNSPTGDPCMFECTHPGCDAYGRLYHPIFTPDDETPHNHPPVIDSKPLPQDIQVKVEEKPTVKSEGQVKLAAEPELICID